MSLINWRAANFRGDNFIFISLTRRCNSCQRSKSCWSLCTLACPRSFTFWRSNDIICFFCIPSWKLNSQDERLVAHKLSNLNRRSFLFAQGEIVVIQMIALAQRCLDHRQPARSYFSKRQRIISLTGDQRLFAKSTMRLALHFTLFSDGAKHRSFPVNFPRSYSRAKLIDR